MLLGIQDAMDCKQMINLVKGKSLRLLCAVSILLIAGALLVWWTVSRADREKRADLLRQTRLVAEAVNAGRIKALTGTEADLEKPEYIFDEALATLQKMERQADSSLVPGELP
jgi:hypothetical protein